MSKTSLAMTHPFRLGAIFLMTLGLSACQDSENAVQEGKEAVTEETPVTRYSAEVFYQSTSFRQVSSGGYAFRADGSRVLVSSDKSGVFNAFALPLNGGPPEQLTYSSTNAMYAVSYFPADDRILYTYDQGGNELNHVIVRSKDGDVEDLTPGKGLKASFIGWLDDGSAFYLASTERDGKSFDVYRYSSDDYSRTRVFENPGFQLGAISGDGRWLALVKPRNSADSDLFIVDLKNSPAEPVLISAHEGNISHGVFDFTPDGKTLVFSTDEHGEWVQAWAYDLTTGDSSPMVKADWDVVYVSHSPGGRYRVTGVNADASTKVSVMDRVSGTALALPALPVGDLSNLRFSRDEQHLVLTVNADNAPTNIFHLDLEGGSVTALTDALNPAISQSDLVSSEVVRYKSFDGLDIPAILYKPRGASKDNKVPALVWVHGGPGGQTRTGYSATRQHLVNQGYAILGANNRGSSGYGKTFFHLDDQRHGEEDLQDIVYGRRYLESLDWVDAERIGIIGGSYGGYMVAAALAFEPEAFDVGINIFGVTNWVRTLESIPPWWEAFKEALYDEMGDPATDAERHRRISPLFHADNIVRPLLVVQGANDPRVLQIESDELVAAVRSNEVPVEYLLFPDEGHGFARKSNRIAASEAYVKFLDQYLKRKEP